MGGAAEERYPFGTSQMQIEGVDIRGNTAHGWAGGGIAVLCTDEGSLFMPLLTDIFRFTESWVKVDETTEITENEATKLSTQTSDHGKGGGLYVLRYSIKDVPTLVVEVASYATVVHDNTSSYSDAHDLAWNDHAGGNAEVFSSSAPVDADGTLRLESTNEVTE